jgi:hypothetical protein
VSKIKKNCLFFGKEVLLFRKRSASFLKEAKKKEAPPRHASFFAPKKEASQKRINFAKGEYGGYLCRTSSRGLATNWN